MKLGEVSNKLRIYKSYGRGLKVMEVDFVWSFL